MIPELHLASDDALAEWGRQVSSMVQDTVDEACLSHPLLNVLASTLTGAHRNEFRLFAMTVLGAAGGDPLDATAVSAISRLWWTGAEALDDIVDGEQYEPPWSRAQLLLVGTACLSVLPLTVIQRAPAHVRTYWLGAFARCSMAAAEGQLQDIVGEPITWERVMSTYVGKTGAAYGAEAAMAARLATSDESELGNWHIFGQILGVLRQVHNDTSDEDDLVNGTPTLLLAHALESSRFRESAMDLREPARTDVSARKALRTLLYAPVVFDGYRQRVLNLHGCARQLLTTLARPSKYRNMLRIMLDVSAAWAVRPHEARP